MRPRSVPRRPPRALSRSDRRCSTVEKFVCFVRARLRFFCVSCGVLRLPCFCLGFFRLAQSCCAGESLPQLHAPTVTANALALASVSCSRSLASLISHLAPLPPPSLPLFSLLSKLFFFRTCQRFPGVLSAAMTERPVDEEARPSLHKRVFCVCEGEFLLLFWRRLKKKKKLTNFP